jgi:hypothetical protein
MTRQPRAARTIAIVLVLVHGIVGLVHGAAHSGLGIEMSPAADVFIYGVIGAGPFVALALLLSRRPGPAGVALAATMTGALLFGAWHHFVVAGPDHVAHVPAGPWQLTFQVTAALLIVTEAAGALAGLALVRLGKEVS